MPKFFNKPQLGQAQLSNAQQSNLPNEDRKAQSKAQQAARSIEQLSGLGQKVVSDVSGAYMANIDAKNRLASGQKRPEFMAHVESQISQTENFESLGSEGLQKKYKEYSESFLEQHQDKPYTSQLRSDMEQMGERMLGNMMQKRDSMHTKIVSDSTSEGSSNAMQMYSEGLINEDQLQGRLAELSYDSTLAFQVPSSSGLDLDDDSRGKYQGLTRAQSNEAILRGAMIQTGQPNNSKVAEMLDNPVFREEMGISPTDQDYNKLIKLAYQRGAKADKINYETSIDNLKEGLYTKTNQGMYLDIDKELDSFKDSGQLITAQDEHKLRKSFKSENKLIIDSGAYVENLSKEKGAYDTTLNMTKKDRDNTWDRGFTDSIGSTGDNMSIETIDAQLSSKEGMSGLSNYLAAGGGVSERVGRMFEIPAGKGSVNNPKWVTANATIQSMSAAAEGSGRSITTILGADRVGKIRAMANIQSNPILSDEDKAEQQLTILDDYSKINSRGYIKPMEGSTVDRDSLIVASRDAEWTTDTLEGAYQNVELLSHYAYQNERAGMSGEDAVDLSIEQFNDGHSQHENPDGTEIAIPVEHKNLNPVGLKMFAKGNKDISSRIGKQNMALFSDYRINRQIGMRKAPDFNVSKDYLLTYDGQIVTDGRFKYEDYSQYIESLPPKFQREVNKDLNKSRKETIEDATKKRERRKSQKGHGETIEFDYGQFNFEFNN